MSASTSAAGPVTDATAPARIQSIDLLRGADVLLMLFVNEVAGVPAAPGWLKHVAPDADGMTITDVVFPAFLLIVGLAVPFAIGGRMRRGESLARVLRHVVSRTAALLVMGVLMVNAEHGIAGPLSPPVWTLVTTAGVFLLWGTPEAGWGRIPRSGWRGLGTALLLLAVLAYRSPEGATGLVQLRPHWWGILGLIGWAYLATSWLYALVGDRPAALAGLMALLYCVALADAAGGLGSVVPGPLLGPVLGTHSAIAMAGVLLGVLLLRHRREQTPPRTMVAEAVALGAALAVAGLLLHALHALHPAFRVSKVLATAPWGLLCSAITVAAWLAIYLAADVVGWRRWPRSLRIVGENPLIAYLLAPALLALFAIATPVLGGSNPYEALADPAAVGLARSAVFAWVVARLTGLLRAGGLRVQL